MNPNTVALVAVTTGTELAAPDSGHIAILDEAQKRVSERMRAQADYERARAEYEESLPSLEAQREATRAAAQAQADERYTEACSEARRRYLDRRTAFPAAVQYDLRRLGPGNLKVFKPKLAQYANNNRAKLIAWLKTSFQGARTDNKEATRRLMNEVLWPAVSQQIRVNKPTGAEQNSTIDQLAERELRPLLETEPDRGADPDLLKKLKSELAKQEGDQIPLNTLVAEWHKIMTHAQYDHEPWARSNNTIWARRTWYNQQEEDNTQGEEPDRTARDKARITHAEAIMADIGSTYFEQSIRLGRPGSIIETSDDKHLNYVIDEIIALCLDIPVPDLHEPERETVELEPLPEPPQALPEFIASLKLPRITPLVLDRLKEYMIILATKGDVKKTNIALELAIPVEQDINFKTTLEKIASEHEATRGLIKKFVYWLKHNKTLKNYAADPDIENLFASLGFCLYLFKTGETYTTVGASPEQQAQGQLLVEAANIFAERLAPAIVELEARLNTIHLVDGVETHIAEIADMITKTATSSGFETARAKAVSTLERLRSEANASKTAHRELEAIEQ
jgi:hypothetical protein